MAKKISKIQLEKDGVIEEFELAGSGGGTSDYDDLTNKPSINGVELTGDKTSNDLDIFSKVDYTYEDDTNTLNLLANEGAGKELTSEHKTGETFNGKPVYERVINVKAGTSVNAWNAVGDVDATVIDKMLLFDANWDGGTGWVSLGKYTTSNNGTAVHISSATNKLYEIHSESVYNSKDVVVVIKYTKK